MLFLVCETNIFRMDEVKYEDNDLSTLVFDDWDDFGDVTSKKSTHLINVSHFNISSASLDTSNRLEVSALCCDEELNGFDKNAGPTWIYPTNYPVRDYQYNIVKAALFKNTLVSLPTGLGKTFIAAVVMYNYYRWYPLGKIIFTAPTRPLVAQQIEACYNIMAIPPQDTIEMTGSMQTSARKIAWQQKRVFFATPQVVHNDLESGTCPGELVRCLVIDEAHRARGRHSYCQLVEALTNRGHSLYRVLALSATPGSKVEDVINVVRNLHISHLELRSENCLDVAMYSHSRNIQTIVVPLGEELSYLRQRYIEILDIYTRRLVQYKILTGNVGSLSKGRIIMLFKEYQNKEKSLRHPQHQTIMHDFTMVITLFHALELLTKHGARVFLNFFDEHSDKGWVGKDDNLTCFLERLRDDLGTNPFSISRETLPDGTVPEITEELKFGHPKFDNLRKIMVDHFKEAKRKGQETKAIVFCEYRESVNLVHCLLLQCRPSIRPHMFIGQGLGASGSSKDQSMKPFSQKQQLRVMKMFREGTCNVLVSTSVGEEGLDVGSVDLIVCFDISNKSPVRLVQRCGRTGRERKGQVVILVTEGKEHQTLRECIMQRDSLNKRVLQSKELARNLYTASPRMIPNNLKSECQKMFITVIKKKEEEEKPQKTKKVQSKIKDMLIKQKNDGTPLEHSKQNVDLSNDEFLSMYPGGMPTFNFFADNEENWNSSKSMILSTATDYKIKNLNDKFKLNVAEWMEWQRNLQYSVIIHHSSDTQILSELLQYADTKRFNIPPNTQNPSFDSQIINTQKFKPKKSPVKKNTKIANNQQKNKNVDIRHLFLKLSKSKDEEQILFDKKLKETLEDCGVKDNVSKDLLSEKEHISSVLIDLMVQLNIEKSKANTADDFSKYDFYSKNSFGLQKHIPSGLSPSWAVPDPSIIDELVKIKNINLKTMMLTQTFSSIPIAERNPLPNKNDVYQSIDKPVNIDCEVSLESFNAFEESYKQNCKVNNVCEKKNIDFDIGDIDDIFGSPCSLKENITSKEAPLFLCDKGDVTPKSDKENINPKNILNNLEGNSSQEPEKPKNPLNFFGLESVEDIFIDELFDDSIHNNKIVCNDKPHKSPERNTSPITISSDETRSQSPILCSQRNKSISKYSKFNESLTPVIKKNKINTLTTNQAVTGDKEHIGNRTPQQHKMMYNSSFHNKSLNINTFQNSIHNTSKIDNNNTSLFTITQLIDIINRPGDLENRSETITNPDKTISNGKDSSDESSKSFILCSQRPKKSIVRKSVNPCKKPQITILETSESSSDDGLDDSVVKEDFSTAIGNKSIDKNIMNNLDDFKSCDNFMESKSKRKLNSSDESNEFSPFFKKTAILNNISHDTCIPINKKETQNRISLKEKLSSTLKTCNQNNVTKSSILNNDSRIVPNHLLDVSIHFKNESKNNMNINASNNCIERNTVNKINHISHLNQFSKSPQPQWISKQRNIQTINNIKNSSDEECSDFVQKPTRQKSLHQDNVKKNLVKTKKKRRKPISEFIDYEAELSDDSYEGTSDENDHTRSSDEHNSSIVKFICDEEHSEHDETVDMEAKYLQSVISPVKTHGKFKIPVLSSRPSAISVYSQVDPDEHASYVLDSFCVDIDKGLTQKHEMSELEIAEAILKKRKRRKRKERPRDSIQETKHADDPAGDSPIARSKKRRVCLRIESESSTDEDLFG